MTRWNVLACAVIACGATALGGGCGLVVGFPDRTLASIEGTGGASASSSGGPGGASASSGGEGGHGGAATTVTSISAASSGSSGGASTYCDTLSPQPLLCNDFEEGQLAPLTQQPFDNGSAALSTAKANPFPGQSFEAHYMGLGDPSKNLGQIYKDFPPGYASMHLGFDVLIEEYAGGAGVTYIAAIELNNGCGAFLYATPGVLKIQQKCPSTVLGDEIISSEVLELHKWTPVDIALDLVSGLPSRITVTIGGVKSIDKVQLVSEWAPGVPTIRLGTVVATTSDARDVFYDDVVFNAP